MSASQIIACTIAWTATAITLWALNAMRRNAASRQDRHIARLARTYDLYVQDEHGNRRLQMTFEEVLLWAEETGHRMLTPGVSVYRRKPGTRLIDGHGVPGQGPVDVIGVEAALSEAQYVALKADWRREYGNGQTAHRVELIDPGSST